MVNFEYTFDSDASFDQRFSRSVYSVRNLGNRIVFSVILRCEIDRWLLDDEDRDVVVELTRNRLFQCWHHEVGFYNCNMFKITEGGIKVCRICRIVYDCLDVWRQYQDCSVMQSKHHVNECGDCGSFCVF